MNFYDNFKVLFPEDGSVTVSKSADSYKITLTPKGTPVKEVRVKWFFDTSFMKKILADSWGVARGDLGWKSPDFNKRAEWYFLAFDGERTTGYGVKTGCKSFCSWQLSEDGITLICDTRNGGEGVELTAPLVCAEAVFYESKQGETPYEASKSFCKMMCEKPNIPKRAIYGFNTWYYTYGDITRASVMEGTRLCARLASTVDKDDPRPLMVIDDGWNKNGIYTGTKYNGGPFVPNDDFCNMKSVAEDISALGCDPGIWIRPLLVRDELLPDMPAECYSENQDFPTRGKVLDPTTEGAKEYIRTLVTEMADCGYKLIKHDFTCPDFMGPDFLKPNLTRGGWHLSDRTKTNAEVLMDLYTLIQDSAKGAHIIGCNVYNHLAAGIHDIVRSGCDTSGKDWQVTKKYGLNCLVYRLCQNKTLLITDADCAAFTDKVPTDLNLDYAELISFTDSALFVSAAPGILTTKDEERLMEAFRRASKFNNEMTPVDWMDTSLPTEFMYDGKLYKYDWK